MCGFIFIFMINQSKNFDLDKGNVDLGNRNTSVDTR